MGVKKPVAPSGAPEWMCTFSDLMSLLLCLFILILAFSEVKQDRKYAEAVESLRTTFGGDAQLTGSVLQLLDPKNTLIQRLTAVDVSAWDRKEGDAEEQGVEGKHWRVTDIRKGVRVEIGGKISFERFSATLMPGAQRLIVGASESIRGLTSKVTVRGHATREPLPPDAAYSDPTDLSYARAKAVAEELVRNGVDPKRIRIEACGDSEPLVAQAYTPERLAQNRRVEIIVTEDTVDEYRGEPIE